MNPSTASPLNPFADDSIIDDPSVNDHELNSSQEVYHETFQEPTNSLHMHLVETNIAPMPTSLPPSPPKTPSREFHDSLDGGSHGGIYALDQQQQQQLSQMSPLPLVDEDAKMMPTTPPRITPEQAPPTPTTAMRTATTNSTATIVNVPDGKPPKAESKKNGKKKKKKSKDKEKKKNANKSTNKKGKQAKDQDGKGRAYQQQYNTQAPSPSARNYDGTERSKIVNYNVSQTKEKKGFSIFRLFAYKPPSSPKQQVNSWEKTPGLDNRSPRSGWNGGYADQNDQFRPMKINIGVTNSADGEGTTIPQLMHRMRVMTLILSGLTIAFESWALIIQAVFLQANKIILGAFLLFFIGLLLCVELVRGTPVPYSVVASAGSGMPMLDERLVSSGLVQQGLNQSFNNAANLVDVVWRGALEELWARRLRYFLQDNFGIFYSCLGRGFLFFFLGSLAWGQHFFVIRAIGIAFMLLGMWTISLKFRYPAFDKMLMMDLDNEFGESRAFEHDDVGESSVISWSSVGGSNRSIGSPNGERRSLIS